MEPIRVLQIVTTMERAGLETMLMNYYRNVDRKKVQFDFLRHRTGEQAYDAEVKAMGGKIYTVPAFNPLNTNHYLTSLDAFFRKHHEYQIVHSHLDCLSAVPLKYAKKNGIRTRIAHSHVSKMSFDLKYPIRMFYRRQIPRIATDLFACSEDAGRWMFGKNRFSVISNAIDCDTFRYNALKAEELRRKNGLEGKLVVGHVGRFDPVKNHVFLIDVFQEIVKQHSNSILLLAGIGNTMEAVKKLVQDFGIEKKVRFLGSVSNVSEIMQVMDIFIFPSLYEGLGISLIEAQASGLPCYTSLNCVPESANIAGHVKYLSLDLSAKEWADIILQDSLKNTVRKNCADEVRKAGYDIKVEAKKLEEMYISYSRG